MNHKYGKIVGYYANYKGTQDLLCDGDSCVIAGEFATRFDPQPFHIDRNAARGSIFGGLVASSLHTMSACTRSVVEAIGEVAILSGVGMYEAKMFNPVRPNDVLSVDAWWTDLKCSQSKPDMAFAGIRCMVTNQKRESVIAYGYRYIVACRNPS